MQQDRTFLPYYPFRDSVGFVRLSSHELRFLDFFDVQLIIRLGTAPQGIADHDHGRETEREVLVTK